jgi:heme-degrading monooxygenase HmoA
MYANKLEKNKAKLERKFARRLALVKENTGNIDKRLTKALKTKILLDSKKD